MFNFMEKIKQIESEFNISKAVDYLEKENCGINEYLRIMFMITYFLKEGEYTEEEYKYYVTYLRKYFQILSIRFSNNSEYLFYMGIIISMGEWYFNVGIEVAEAMKRKANLLEPDNELYQWIRYDDLDMREKDNKNKVRIYAKRILGNEKITEELSSKGLLGQYITGMLEFLLSSQ